MTNKALFLPYKIIGGKPYYLICKRTDDKSNNIFIPTGTCEIGENQADCAFRELREEFGVKDFSNFFSLNLNQKFTSSGRSYFEKAFAFEIRDRIKLQKEELAWYEFVPLKKAFSIVRFDFHKKVISACDKILNDKSYNKIFAVIGPGGSGKDTLIHQAVKQDRGLTKIKTYMTRHYKSKDDSKLRIYVSEKKLQGLERKGDIIEKNKMVGFWYASSYMQMIKALSRGKDGIINVDINGAEFYKKNFSNVITIFINADTGDLIRRLKARQRDSDEYIKKRMKVAKEEIAKSKICDYTIVNRENQIKESMGELIRIVKENR